MLRGYQVHAIDELRQAFRSGYRTIGIMMATGGGKTEVAKAIIESLLKNNKKVAFVCDILTLIGQTSRKFDDAGIDHGIIQGFNERYKPSQPVQVCSVQTLSKRVWPKADFVFIDEFHTLYKEHIKMIEGMPNTRFIGLSATPFTKGLGKYWQKLIVGARTSDLIDQGYLSKFEVYGPPPPDLSKVKVQAGDYNQKQLGKKVDKPKVIGDIVENWQKHGENRQTICFAVNIEHSKHIVNAFNAAGIPAAHMDCYTKDEDRQEIHAQFIDKKIRVISSVDVLTKGYDEPSATCLIMSRPTKSLIVYIQQFGRILRVSEDHDRAIVFDHGGNVERHGFPTDPLPELLCMGEKKEAKREKQEKKPKHCPKCFYMKPPMIQVCPSCGFEAVHMNKVANTDDELVKIKKVDITEKREWYGMLLYIARAKGYQDGWASHKYKAKFGVWPHKKVGVHPMKPTEEVLNWMKYVAIKGRYDKQKESDRQGSLAMDQATHAGTGH